jgi:hypothetical protein
VELDFRNLIYGTLLRPLLVQGCDEVEAEMSQIITVYSFPRSARNSPFASICRIPVGEQMQE